MKNLKLNTTLLIFMVAAFTLTVIFLFTSNQQLLEQNRQISEQLSSVVKSMDKVEQRSIDTTRRIDSIEQQLKPNLHNLLAKN